MISDDRTTLVHSIRKLTEKVDRVSYAIKYNLLTISRGNSNRV